MDKLLKLLTGGLQNCCNVVVNQNNESRDHEVDNEKSLEIKSETLTSYQAAPSIFSETLKNSENLATTESKQANLSKSDSFNQTSDFFQELLFYTEIGEFLKIKELIDTYKPELNLLIKGKETVLHIASRSGHAKICELFLTNGADVNFKDSAGRSALHLACKVNDRETVKTLLAFSPDVSLLDSLGKTALFYAISNNNHEIVDLLEDFNMIQDQLKTDCQVLITDNSESSVTVSSFKLLQKIGSGRFGSVYLASYKPTGQLYALKVITKEKMISENLVKYSMSERSILGKISHPFIVKLHFAFQCEEKLYLALSYYSGGPLSGYLRKYGKFSEGFAKFYLCEIVLALEELHKKSIIYRDLKPDNVLIDGTGHVGLADFGLSKQGISENEITDSFCGSVAYMAPEVLMQTGHGKTVDWYLLGVLFYEMLFACTPFYTPDRRALSNSIKLDPVNLPDQVSQECRDLLFGLLEKDPKLRLGYKSDASEIKQHPFFSSVDWNMIYQKRVDPPIKASSSPTVMFSLTPETDNQSNRLSHKFNWSFRLEDKKH
jgi:hypothetical protein